MIQNIDGADAVEVTLTVKLGRKIAWMKNVDRWKTSEHYNLLDGINAWFSDGSEMVETTGLGRRPQDISLLLWLVRLLPDMTVSSYHDILVTVSFRQFVPFWRWNNFIVIISAWHISVLVSRALYSTCTFCWCFFFFGGATALGGPWPPLQYASKPFDPLLYLTIRLFPSFSGPWTRHPVISFLVFLFILLHTAFRTTSFLELRCLAFFLYDQAIVFFGI